MTYPVNPADPTSPLDSQGARQGAEEFRALKAYIATLAGISGVNLFGGNVLIGSEFTNAPWQRGTSFAAIANNTYAGDRWKYVKSGAMVHTASKAANAPTLAQAGIYTVNCFQLQCTTIDAAIAAGDYCAIQQVVEGPMYLPLVGVSIVVKFWHCHTKVGTYCVGVYNVGGTRAYVAEYTQAVSDAWEVSTIVIPADAAPGAVNVTPDTSGLRILFTVAAGTTFQGAANVWTTSATMFLGTANQVNGVDNVANFFRLQMIDLRFGLAAPTYTIRSPIDELKLCERYFEKSFNQGVTPVSNAGLGTGEWRFTIPVVGAVLHGFGKIPFRTLKASGVNITLYNPLAAGAEARNITDNVSYTGTVLQAQDTSGFTIQGTANAGATAGETGAIHWTAEHELV